MSTILVTGANKGLGLELVARLAQLQPHDTILLGCRSVQNGRAGLEKLVGRGIATEKIVLLEVDVTSQASVDAASATIKKDYAGTLSTIFSNAGIAMRGDDFHKAKSVMEVNYYGVKRVVQTLGQLLSKNGHLVVVSSALGASATYVAPTALHDVLRKPQSVETIDALVERYLSALDPHFEDAQSARLEFPDPVGAFGPYAMSKAFVNTYIQSVAPVAREKLGIALVAVCPGFCATDLNANSGPRKPSTGARSIALAANVPTSEAGGFFRDGNPLQYSDAPQSLEKMVEDAKKLESTLQKTDPLLR